VPPTPEPVVYRFGPFELDLAAAELRTGSRRIPLRPKCFDVLAYLIARRGKLVQKNTLLEDVWQDAIVSDATISRTVASIRAALEDDPAEPRYLATVSRRGYKFIAEATEVGEIRNARASSSSAKSAPLMLVQGSDEHPLADGIFVIGRSDDADIRVYASAASRRHARVEVSGQSVTLHDLESRHGTFLNGERVDGSVPVEPGDTIEIAGERFVLWSPGGKTSPEPAKPRR
jgi:DNA-binding winged helix-turn-helix (wHTH) protein